MVVAVIFNLVGVALVLWAFRVFNVAVGGIHEVYAMVSLGFGLLIMAVASGAGAIVHAIGAIPATGVSPRQVETPTPPARVMTDWDKPRS